MFVGVDGCKAGWFAVNLNNKYEYEIDIFSNIVDLWNTYSDSTLILIDIPIGLPGKDIINRNCDLESRKILGPKKGSCVFPAPCRQAVYVKDYDKASHLNRKIIGKGLSCQVWNIAHKIRETDMLMTSYSNARNIVRESHPEICFFSMAGRAMEYSKKTDVGIEDRLRILESFYGIANEIFCQAIRGYKRKYLARDDILDALSLAVTAREKDYPLVSIPQDPQYDKKGLKMEIVYRKWAGVNYDI